MVQVMWERALPAKGATRFAWFTASPIRGR